MSLIKNTPFEMEQVLSVILIACIATIIQAINLPLMFKFGVEKGRLAFFALIVAVTCG